MPRHPQGDNPSQGVPPRSRLGALSRTKPPATMADLKFWIMWTRPLIFRHGFRYPSVTTSMQGGN